MKPIKTKLTPDQVFALEEIMKHLPKFTPTQELEKVTKSIILEVADKINVKYRKIVKSHDLFNARTKISFELKYHEAFALVVYTELMLPAIDSTTKPHNDLLMLHNHLHQKIQ